MAAPGRSQGRAVTPCYYYRRLKGFLAFLRSIKEAEPWEPWNYEKESA